MIRGTKRKIDREETEIKVPVSARFHNRFDVEVIDVRTGEVRQRARGFNIILDRFWTTIMAANGVIRGYFNYIHYGRGEGTPAATDTTLFDKIAAVARTTANTTVTMGASREFGYAQAFIEIAPETSVGETITEVGIGDSFSNIVTHAMLEDMNGNPISIEKTATDRILIYATIYLHWQIGGWSNGSIVPVVESYNGASNLRDVNTIYGIIGHFCGVSGSDHWGCRFRVGPNADGTTDGGDYDSRAYDSSTKKLTFSKRFSTSQVNTRIAAIKVQIYGGGGNESGSLILFTNSGGWYTPTQITGEAVGTGDGTRSEFSTMFPIRGSATVLVNGAAASVTTRGGSNDGAGCSQFMRTISPDSTPSLVLYSGTGQRSGYSFVAPYSNDLLFENPYYSVGLSAVRHYQAGDWSAAYTIKVSASNDLQNWEDLTIDRAYVNPWVVERTELPSTMQHKRFFKLRALSNNGNQNPAVDFYAKGITGGNIQFATAPAAGAVITASYLPDCIAKDSNHVLDVTLELTLDEY